MTATLTNFKCYIIEPELAVNMCVNPSAEAAIAGIYAGTNCTVTQSAEQARYGLYSVKGVPTGANDAANIYTTIVATAVQHSYSVGVYGAAGINYTVQIQNTGGTVMGSTALVGNGHWQRASVSATLTAASYNFIVTRNANQNTTAAFYTDGWLVKVGGDNLYFDGDTVDPYNDEPQFYWNGARNASTSTRKASTRYGGTLLDISTQCTLRGIQGLGMTTFETNTSGLALGGELYQNSHANAREFALICQVHADLTEPIGVLQRKIARIQKAVNPKRMNVDQPLRLLFVGYDSAGVEASDRVIIDCVYEDGLPGEATARVVPFILTFRQFDPLIPADGYNVTSLSASGTAVDGGTFGSILMVSQDTGANTAITGFGAGVNGITQDNSGGFYIFGAFLNYGDANGDGIVYRNSAGTISSMGSGANGTSIYCAEFGLDGKLYVGGLVDNIGGDANADNIASWSGTAWAALAGGLNGAVSTICVDNSGNLYAGGAFTQAKTGPVTLNGIGKWNGSAWSACGSGTVGVAGGTTQVLSLVALFDNRIVLAGEFTSAGGDAAIDYLAVYNPTANTLSALGTVPNGIVRKLLYDKSNGILYAFGDFTQIGGISANYAAFWDGNNWNPMPGATVAISSANIGINGRVISYGSWTINGVTYANSVAEWTGDRWRLVESQNDKILYSTSYRKLTNELAFVGLALAGSTTYTIPAVSTITNSTEGNIYPRVTFDATGSYVYSLWNRTTGERIYLNGLTVGAGERIEMAFNPTGYTMNSNIRGDMRSSVQSGSSPTFHLQPGANYVSVFVYPSPVTNVTVPLKYPASGYISLDETVYP